MVIVPRLGGGGGRIDREAAAGLNGASLSQATLLAVASGTVGAVIFAVVWLVEGTARAGYNQWAEPISALSLGPGGAVQRANFIFFGTLVICSAIGWRRVLVGGTGGTAYPLLRAIEGVALVVDGIFSQDADRGYPPGALLAARSLPGTIHSSFAFLAIASIALGWLVFARRLRVERGWRAWAKYALLTGVLVILFIAAFGASSGQGGVAGLYERLATVSSLPLSLAIIGRLVLQSRGS